MEQKDYAEGSELTSTRARTRRLLIETAMRLFDGGAFPSVTDVAMASALSRATAYRYFPTQSALIDAVVSTMLDPIDSWKPDNQDAFRRLDELVDFAFPRLLQHEGTLRAALHLSLTQWAEAQSTNASVAQRSALSNSRQRVLTQLAEPLSHELSPALQERMIRALSLVYGTEFLLVMKDIWHCDDDELAGMAKWIAKAIIHQAQADART